MKKIEELVVKWMNFREDDFDDEDDLLQNMVKIQRRKKELKVLNKEWHAVWMLKKVQKRIGMEHF